MTLHEIAVAVAPVWRGSTGSDTDDRVTEALAGEPVQPTGAQADGRVEVVVPWQPSSLHTDGYPGWVDASHIGSSLAAEPSLTVPAEVFEGASEDPVERARRLLGTAYVWGGLGAHGIDCSGLVHLVHRSLGRVVPRDARDQAAALPSVRLTDVRRGDLFFFAREGRPVHHVGFVVDPDTILHASYGEDRAVVEQPLTAERRETLVSAGRIGPGLR